MPDNPPAIPIDTTREAWNVQMRAIALMSPHDRFERVAELNELLDQLELDGIKRAHPNYSQRQLFLTQMRRRYPRETFEACWTDAATELPSG